jgi:hypothetical protein
MTVKTMTDEEYVRAHWGHIGVYTYGGPDWYVNLPDGCRDHQFAGRPESAAWAAAADYTRERIERIREIEEEICEVEFVSRNFFGDRGDCWKRIIARLESALTVLRKGMTA